MELDETSDVGRFESNPWGLFDMHGNVWEWCQDRFGEYTSDAATNPLGPTKGDHRVLRGGSWGSGAWSARSASRAGDAPDAGFNDRIGFRCAQVQKESRVSEQTTTSGSDESFLPFSGGEGAGG